MTAILEQAKKDGYSILIDGTNASDDASDRPGMAALKELSVRSPLQEAGLTKTEIRKLSKEAGLFTWDKPAYACLATRIPADTPITAESLRLVEQGEDILRSMGFRDLRVRLREGYALLQFAAAELAEAGARLHEIEERLSPLFPALKLDSRGR